MMSNEEFLNEYEQLQSVVAKKDGETILINVSVPENDNSRRRVSLYHIINNEQNLVSENEVTDIDDLYFNLLPLLMERFIKSNSDIKEENYVSKAIIEDEETSTHIFSASKATFELIGIEASVIEWLINKKNNIVNENALSDYDIYGNGQVDISHDLDILISEGKNVFFQLGELFPWDEKIVEIQKQLVAFESSLDGKGSIINDRDEVEDMGGIVIPKGVDPNSFIQPDFLQEQIAEEMQKSIENLAIEEQSKSLEYEIDPSSLIPQDIMVEQLAVMLADDKLAVDLNETKGIDPDSYIQPDFLQEQIAEEMQKSMLITPFEQTEKVEETDDVEIDLESNISMDILNEQLESAMNDESEVSKENKIDVNSNISVDVLMAQLASAMGDTVVGDEPSQGLTLSSDESPKSKIDLNSNISMDILNEQLNSAMTETSDGDESSQGLTLSSDESPKSKIDLNSNISMDILNEQLNSAINETPKEGISEGLSLASGVGSNNKIDLNSKISMDILNEQLNSAMSEVFDEGTSEELILSNKDDVIVDNKTNIPSKPKSNISSKPVPEPEFFFDRIGPSPVTLFEQIFVATKELREQLGDLFFSGYCVHKLQEKGIVDLDDLIKDMDEEYKRLIDVDFGSFIGAAVRGEDDLESGMNVKHFEVPEIVIAMLDDFRRERVAGVSNAVERLKDSQMKLEIGNVLREILNDNTQLEEIAAVTNKNLTERSEILDSINSIIDNYINEIA